MPFGDPDPTDPTVLVGVGLPAAAEATREMAWVFAEEFARLGHGAAAIVEVFASPFYVAAHRAYRDLGEAEIRAIVDECVKAWSPEGRRGE